MSMALKQWLIISTGINLHKKKIRSWAWDDVGSESKAVERVSQRTKNAGAKGWSGCVWASVGNDVVVSIGSRPESQGKPLVPVPAIAMPISSVDSHDHERYPHPILSPISILSPWSPC
jgi:hypothetical protein